MSFIGATTIAFQDFDTDSQTVTSTGDTLANIFTNLQDANSVVRTKQREILLRNDGSVNLLIGKTLATARFPILPGDSLKIALLDLSKAAIKSSGTNVTVIIFQII